MIIDPHVHLRDWNESYKGETIKHGLEVARDSGVDAVFDMPNTNPPIISRARVVDRLKMARDADVPEVFYGLYIGLTANPDQIEEAVETYNEFFPQVVGLKLYTCETTGSLSVKEWGEQRIVYETLAKHDFKGVLAVHCEKEIFWKLQWNPEKPESHCDARPAKSEVESIKDQIRLANIAYFKGKIHIAHVSTSLSVEIIHDAKRNLSLDLSCGICMHHLLYSREQMKKENGHLWKMNPPLRTENTRLNLFFDLLTGRIDWIESDHAPHTLEEKGPPKYCSGIPGLPWWQYFIEYLRRNGFGEEQIEDLTFNNATKRFGLNIKKTKRPLVYRGDDYEFNPYEILMNKEVAK